MAKDDARPSDRDQQSARTAEPKALKTMRTSRRVTHRAGGRAAVLFDGVIVGLIAGSVLAVSQWGLDLWNETLLHRQEVDRVAELFDWTCRNINGDGMISGEERDLATFVWEEARRVVDTSPHLAYEQKFLVRLSEAGWNACKDCEGCEDGCESREDCDDCCNHCLDPAEQHLLGILGSMSTYGWMDLPSCPGD